MGLNRQQIVEGYIVSILLFTIGVILGKVYHIHVYVVFVYLGRNSADLGWSSNISSSSKSTWSTQNPASPANDMWNKGTSRPPPGFNKNMNRSMSMPQGPSEKTSAFSPGTSNVYIKTTCLELVTKTFRLRIIIM